MGHLKELQQTAAEMIKELEWLRTSLKAAQTAKETWSKCAIEWKHKEAKQRSALEAMKAEKCRYQREANNLRGKLVDIQKTGEKEIVSNDKL